MSKSKLTVLFLVVFFALQGFHSGSYSNKVSADLQKFLGSQDNNSPILVWVKFQDKGSNERVQELLAHPELYLTERSIERRKKVMPEIADESDLPLNNTYLGELQSRGITIKNKSKWFNSVSTYLTPQQILALSSEDYISSFELVAKFTRDYATFDGKQPEITGAGSKSETAYSPNVLNYGPSLQQVQQINVPAAHDAGYFGQGIMIASFDTGVDNLNHPAFDSIRARGIRTFDFVNGDTSVANQSGQQGEGSHGSKTLSLVCGYAVNKLIAPAFRSKIIVAKTENTDSETPAEEDNWIAAAEWADSLGADIITSSLGYREMDQGSIRSYDWTWMNGDSCLITIGADLVVKKGILVVNSAANNGYNANHNTLGAPADGDSVLTVGSVESNGTYSDFSSVGPTVDGRIKPDVSALGSGNQTIQSGAGNTGYSNFGSGTSFACPLVAGAAGVILSANPSLTPMQVISILKSSASNTNTPNNRIGWGIINCWQAVQTALTMSGIDPVNGNIPTGFSLNQNYPNPFNPTTLINYQVGKSSNVALKVFDVNGRLVKVLQQGTKQAGNYTVEFNAENFSSGIYLYSLEADGTVLFTRKMMFVK